MQKDRNIWSPNTKLFEPVRPENRADIVPVIRIFFNGGKQMQQSSFEAECRNCFDKLHHFKPYCNSKKKKENSRKTRNFRLLTYAFSYTISRLQCDG